LVGLGALTVLQLVDFLAHGPDLLEELVPEFVLTAPDGFDAAGLESVGHHSAHSRDGLKLLDLLLLGGEFLLPLLPDALFVELFLGEDLLLDAQFGFERFQSAAGAALQVAFPGLLRELPQLRLSLQLFDSNIGEGLLHLGVLLVDRFV
jgi:hypothetical protein